MNHLLLTSFFFSQVITSSVILAYSKVTKNGEARANSQDVAITVSPVYFTTQRTFGLRPGEVINHPSTSKYSTLDEELLAKLDSLTNKKKAQDRFHPPASFEHVLSHSNALKQSANSNSLPISSSSNNDVIYSKPIVSMTYDYPPTNFDVNSKPITQRPLSSNSFQIYSPSKLPDTYSNGQDSEIPPSQSSEYDSRIPNFDFDHPPKGVEFPIHYDRPFEDAPLYAQDPYHQDEVIYDHIPEDHLHHHHHHPKPTTTTEEPEMMDQRLNKRPYSYYYIGKKLWYVPLYFSIYFIIYIAALVLKSIARHKINFPANLAAVAAGADARSLKVDNAQGPGWMDYAARILEAIETFGSKT